MRVERGVNHVKSLIPFMNKVFHKNFPRLLPKLYTSDKYADNHYVVYDNDKVVGALASIPNTLHVGDMTLDTRGIGMVSCHKRYRGQGIMSSMLKTAIVDAKAESADFMYLSGNRQRYEHYGFVPCGYKYNFTLTTANFPHMKEKHDYTFVRIKDNSGYLGEIESIYAAQAVRYDRDDFMKVVHSWNTRKVYAILNSNNVVVGHLATLWYRIVDISTIEPQNMAYIVRAFAKMSTKFFGRIELYPTQDEAVVSMARDAQVFTLEQPASFKILNFRHVVEVLLYQEALTHALPDFDMNIVILGKENFSVHSHDNITSVADFDASLDTAEFKDDIDATLHLFSPAMQSMSGLPFTLRITIPFCDNQ